MDEHFHNWLVQVRRDFHQHPELGYEENRTSKKIAQYLEEMGIEYTEGVANTGVVGIIRGGQEGKTVALRADIDALPIHDEKKTEYRSKVDGKMHACGHDAHTTILLGTAKVLNDMKESLKGNVKLFFQPAEETTGGAKPMIEAGVMENPHVDAVFGLHMDSSINTGTIGIKYGKMNAASDMFDLVIHGVGAHGAYPQNGVDAVTASAQIISALQTVVSRNVDPRDSAVISIGSIHGGAARNVICDRIEMQGIIRTMSPKTREMVLERVQSVIHNTAEALGAKAEFIRHEGYTSLINHDEYVDIVKENAEKLLGKDSIIERKEVSMGVEDFAFFLEKAPGAFFNIGCRNEGKGIIYPAHHCMFDIDEDSLLIGVKMQVENVKSVLS